MVRELVLQFAEDQLQTIPKPSEAEDSRTKYWYAITPSIGVPPHHMRCGGQTTCGVEVKPHVVWDHTTVHAASYITSRGAFSRRPPVNCVTYPGFITMYPPTL
ncbi:MAG: hypothetical protein LBL24_00575 [Bacteroidales bacterium]|nr:hypothetical protein [Bacteroidales bacterium]